MEPAISLSGVGKTFGATVAVRDLDQRRRLRPAMMDMHRHFALRFRRLGLILELLCLLHDLGFFVGSIF